MNAATLRPIAAITESSGKPLRRNPVPPPPRVAWIPLANLVVDDGYQRAISGQGLRQIRRMVENWDWRRFKPLSVASVEITGGGQAPAYEVLDGQHLAIAAATHGSIETLPCLVLDAVTRADRSAAFVGINRDRLTLTPFALYRARIIAGEEHARDVDQALKDSGATLHESFKSNEYDYQPGDLSCVSTLLLIRRQYGAAVLTEALKAAIAGAAAPVPSTLLKGVAEILAAKQATSAEIAEVLLALGPDDIVEMARGRVRMGSAAGGPAACLQIILHSIQKKAA